MATITYWSKKHHIIRSAGGRPARVNNATFDHLMRLGYDATERHQLCDGLTQFRSALRVRPGDRYAKQAVWNVRTDLQH